MEALEVPVPTAAAIPAEAVEAVEEVLEVVAPTPAILVLTAESLSGGDV